LLRHVPMAFRHHMHSGRLDGADAAGVQLPTDFSPVLFGSTLICKHSILIRRSRRKNVGLHLEPDRRTRAAIFARLGGKHRRS
jgi:hypothetical protein